MVKKTPEQGNFISVLTQRLTASLKLDPVREDEIVEPTRVSWSGSRGRICSRIYPTVDRAMEFAFSMRGSLISDANEPVPPQPKSVANGFTKMCSQMSKPSKVSQRYRFKQRCKVT